MYICINDTDKRNPKLKDEIMQRKLKYPGGLFGHVTTQRPVDAPHVNLSKTITGRV